MQVLARRVLTFLGSFYSCSQKYKKVWHFLRKTLDICLRFGYNNTRRQGHGPRRKEYADVAELADALDSGSSSLKRVWVQIPSSAPKSSNVCSGIFCFSDLFGMTSIVPRTVGADSYPPAEPCHYCKRPGSLASIDLHSAGGSRFSAIDTATAPILHWNRGCTILWQYRIILSADTASEVRQLLSQKRR